MRIKRRLTTLLFKGWRSFHIKAPHSFDVRIGVGSRRWRFPGADAHPGNPDYPDLYRANGRSGREANLRGANAFRPACPNWDIQPGGFKEFAFADALHNAKSTTK